MLVVCGISISTPRRSTCRARAWPVWLARGRFRGGVVQHRVGPRDRAPGSVPVHDADT